MPPLPGTAPTPPGSAKPPVSGAGTKYTFGNIMWLWIKNGGSVALAPIMAGIAMAESGGNWFNLNNNAKTGDYSVGLWQINYFGNLLGPRSAKYGTPAQLRADPNLQAKAAIDLAQGGKGLGNWTTWTNRFTNLKSKNPQSSPLYWINLNKGTKPENPGVGAGGQITPGGIAGSIANALIPDWLNSHNLVRVGQGIMGFTLVVLGIVVLAKDTAKSGPVQDVAGAAAAVTPAGREAAGMAYLGGRKARGRATSGRSRQGKVSAGTERMTLREPKPAKPEARMSEEIPF